MSAPSQAAIMNRNLKRLQDQRTTQFKPRFSLRTLLLLNFTVAFSIIALRAIAQRYGLVSAAVTVLAALSILAHIAGAAIGSRFRKQDATPHKATDEQDDDSSDRFHHQPLSASAYDFAPATELSEQRPLVRRPIYWGVGLGAVCSAILASVVLTLFMWDNLAIGNILFGAFSAAVLGGLLGFWVTSFFQVVRSALADAEKED